MSDIRTNLSTIFGAPGDTLANATENTLENAKEQHKPKPLSPLAKLRSKLSPERKEELPDALPTKVAYSNSLARVPFHTETVLHKLLESLPVQANAFASTDTVEDLLAERIDSFHDSFAEEMNADHLAQGDLSSVLPKRKMVTLSHAQCFALLAPAAKDFSEPLIAKTCVGVSSVQVKNFHKRCRARALGNLQTCQYHECCSIPRNTEHKATLPVSQCILYASISKASPFLNEVFTILGVGASPYRLDDYLECYKEACRRIITDHWKANPKGWDPVRWHALLLSTAWYIFHQQSFASGGIFSLREDANGVTSEFMVDRPVMLFLRILSSGCFPCQFALPNLATIQIPAHVSVDSDIVADAPYPRILLFKPPNFLAQ